MSAVVLAGGLGTRLRTVVSDRQKVMADVHGRPFLSLVLDQLEAIGFNEVVLSTGYKSESLVNYFGQDYGQMRLTYSNEEVPLGTGGALKLAQRKLSKEHTLVMNGDSLVHFDFNSFLSWHWSRKSDVTLLLSFVTDVNRYGVVELDETGKVRSFREKSSQVSSGLINTGVYLIRTAYLQKFPEFTEFSLERDFFPSLAGRKFYGFTIGNQVWDIGTPEAYKEFLNQPNN